MRLVLLLTYLALPGSAVFCQAPATLAFEVSSVKPSARLVGPDYNNRLTLSSTGIRARNVTLRRLVGEAYQKQLNQVLGPDWLDQNEYDVEAQAGQPVEREQLALMLRSLLAERFNLRQHGETKDMRVYELVVGKGGPRIRPVKDGETPKAVPGLHFQGELRAFADLLAVQLSITTSNNPNEPAKASGPPIPVLDRTGLQGTYEFTANIKPEPGADMFILWQRTLQDQLGLRLEDRKGKVDVIVVDAATKIPTAN